MAPPETRYTKSGDVDIAFEFYAAVQGLSADGQFLHAFANALHGVFLWGMGVAAAAFLLTWWLKEVPLRTQTYAQAQVGAEEAAAGGTGSEALAG